MRLIDAIAYRKALEEEKEAWGRCVGEVFGLEIATADLSDMPTIDAVPVVRCKNCYKKGKSWCPMYGSNSSSTIDENFYCKSGERRATDEEI